MLTWEHAGVGYNTTTAPYRVSLDDFSLDALPPTAVIELRGFEADEVVAARRIRGPSPPANDRRANGGMR